MTLTCSECADTHQVYSEQHGRFFMCTACPIPCQVCRRAGTGAFCESKPCWCDCHRKDRGVPSNTDAGEESKE